MPPDPRFAVRVDQGAPPGDVLRPLVALLRQIAARRRPAPPDVFGEKATTSISDKETASK